MEGQRNANRWPAGRSGGGEGRQRGSAPWTKTTISSGTRFCTTAIEIKQPAAMANCTECANTWPHTRLRVDLAGVPGILLVLYRKTSSRNKDASPVRTRRPRCEGAVGGAGTCGQGTTGAAAGWAGGAQVSGGWVWKSEMGVLRYLSRIKNSELRQSTDSPRQRKYGP